MKKMRVRTYYRYRGISMQDFNSYQLFINHLNFLSYFAIKMKTRAVKKKAKMAMMAQDQQQFTMIILKMGKMTILTRRKLERRRTMTRLTKKMVSKRFYTYSIKSLDQNYRHENMNCFKHYNICYRARRGATRKTQKSRG